MADMLTALNALRKDKTNNQLVYDVLVGMATRIIQLESAAIETNPAPAPDTVTISKAAFDEAIKVLTLVLGNLDDEPYATTNRLIHAIGVLKGDINPLPF